MRKKILNEREKQLPGAAAVQQEHKTTDKAAPSGRQTAPSAPAGRQHEQAEGRGKGMEGTAAKWQKRKQQQLWERRQSGAAVHGKNTAPGTVQPGSPSPAAETPVQKQPLSTGEAMYREYILPYTARQQQNILAHEIASGGKLPEGYRWHRTGDTAYATKNLASKPLAAATAAGQPAVFGLDPSEYVKHMQAIDAYNDAAGGQTKKEQKKLTAD